MSVHPERTNRIWSAALNLPNQLTYLRILLAIVMFCTIAWERYLAATVLFILAAGTDWLDGYFARKYGQITALGRILDPFADKVIICGTFIFLATIPGMRDAGWGWGLRPWMVVVVVGRELLVTAIRSFIEEQGGDFSANWSGKIKMILQCVAVPAWLIYFYCLGDGSHEAVPTWIAWTAVISLWAAVIQTVYSGLIYVVAAVRMVRSNP